MTTPSTTARNAFERTSSPTTRKCSSAPRRRRNKLMGLWVADILGKSEEEAEAYAERGRESRFRGSRPRGRDAQGDGRFSATGWAEAEVRRKYDELLAVAKGQLVSEN